MPKFNLTFDAAAKACQPGQYIIQRALDGLCYVADALPGSFVHRIYRRDYAGNFGQVA